MRDYKYGSRGFSRKMIVAIAALLTLLAATAVAVVQGNLLRTKIEESAGEEFANQVQDVHFSGGDENFSFTVDEIVWEDDKMYLSYSVSVPDDGNTYLYALYSPKLNGEALDYGYANFYNDASIPVAYVIGGEFGSADAQVIKDIAVDPQMKVNANNVLDMQAVFFKSNRPVAYAGEWEDYMNMYEEMLVSENENGARETVQLMPDSNTLYYYGAEPEAHDHPFVKLDDLPEYHKLRWDELQETQEMRALEPEEFAATGIVDLVDSVELSIPVDASEAQGNIYNDLAQHKFEMDGFELEFTDFRLSHLSAFYSAEISMDAEIPDEYTGSEPYDQFYALLRADGSEVYTEFGSSFGGGYVGTGKGGELVYKIDQEIRGIIPVEEIDSLLLAPQIFKENGEFSHYDLEQAIRIEPVYNPNKSEPTPQPAIDPAANDDLSS